MKHAQLSAILVMLLLALQPALADKGGNGRSGRSGAERSPQNGQTLAPTQRIGRDRAAAIAQQATGGRVLRVEQQGNRYLVRVLVAGERIRTVRVDAATGELR